MIPLILAAVGGYLVSDSLSSRKKFAKGGGVEQPIGEAEAKNVDNNPKEIIKKLKERKSDKAIHAEIFQKNGYNVFIYDNNKVLIDKTFKTHEEAKKYLNDWASQNGKENQLKYEYGTITDIAKLPYRQEITGNIPKDFIEQNKIKKESIADPKVGVNLDENEEQTVYLKVKPRFNDELNEKAEKENLHLEFIEDDEDGYEVYRAEMTRVQLSDFKKEIPFTYSFKR